ncbi:MAG: ABC transporter ATP-binding protein [Planctomycetota bacterium]|jgi:iron(III) transport system ATP-binding protein
MSQALEVSGVTVAIGDSDVLTTPVDLTLRAGEHVLLVGRSGCGKTTLLRTIAGLLPATAGKITIAGRVTDDGPKQLLPAQERGIGYLPQGGALWPHLSVGRTLDFVLKQGKAKKSERARRVAELLAMVELDGYEDRLPATLSGGEAQRVALARALALHPTLLLLDEPLGPLDTELRGALAILHVTHDPREAAATADRALRLEGSRLSPYETEARGDTAAPAATPMDTSGTTP